MNVSKCITSLTLAVLAMLVPSNAQASELRICNEGSISAKVLALAESISGIGANWSVRGWVSVAPNKCAVVWTGSYSLIHLVYTVEVANSVAVVSYKFEEKSGYDEYKPRRRSAICASGGTIDESGSGSPPSIYRPPCGPSVQEIPTSGMAVIGERVNFTIPIDPTSQQPGKIEKILGIGSNPAADAEKFLTTGRKALLYEDFAAALAAYDEAARISPSGIAFLGRSTANYYLGNFSAAYEDATRALEGEGFGFTWRARAIALEAQAHGAAALGRAEEAAETYWNAYVAAQGLSAADRRTDPSLDSLYEAKAARCGIKLDPATVKTKYLYAVVLESVKNKCVLSDPADIRLP